MKVVVNFDYGGIRRILNLPDPVALGEPTPWRLAQPLTFWNLTGSSTTAAIALAKGRNIIRTNTTGGSLTITLTAPNGDATYEVNRESGTLAAMTTIQRA